MNRGQRFPRPSTEASARASSSRSPTTTAPRSWRPPPGTYKILVDDLAADHNFHLLGPGVDLSTGTEQVGSVTWTATFANNSNYVFQCDTHAAEMTGMFVVGHPASTTTGQTTSPTTTVNTGHPTPVMGTLASSVSSGQGNTRG